MRAWRWPVEARLCSSHVKRAANQRARFEQFCGMWRSAGAAVVGLPLASGQSLRPRPFPGGRSGRRWLLRLKSRAKNWKLRVEEGETQYVASILFADWKQAQTPRLMRAESRLGPRALSLHFFLSRHVKTLMSSTKWLA